jgi:hypothetical protein
VFNNLSAPSGAFLLGVSMETIKAFLQGVAEFRLSFTTHYENPSLARAYDQGRELAHKVTLRRFETS